MPYPGKDCFDFIHINLSVFIGAKIQLLFEISSFIQFFICFGYPLGGIKCFRKFIKCYIRVQINVFLHFERKKNSEFACGNQKYLYLCPQQKQAYIQKLKIKT